MTKKISPSCSKPIDRAENDFYATPRSAIQQLLEREKFQGTVWEPACDNGAISDCLVHHGYKVISTDLIDRGYGEGGRDFLQEKNGVAKNIITNPPFKLGTDFVRHALKIVPGKVCMLLKIGFLEGPTKEDLHDQLSRIWIIRRRVTFLKNGKEFSRSGGKGGIHTYAWFVWAREYRGAPEVRWLEGEACK